MTDFALNRIFNELIEVLNDPPDGITVMYNEEDLNCWTCYLVGPNDTPYENMTYELEIQFPQSYPYKPPIVQFITPMFHPNVTKHGLVVISVLQWDWTPALKGSDILLYIRSLCDNPEILPAEYMNNHALTLFRENPELYKTTVMIWFKGYIGGNSA